jgi:hypothetical protein
MEWGKGLVQREEEERNRQQLEREKTRDVARCAILAHVTNRTNIDTLWEQICG